MPRHPSRPVATVARLRTEVARRPALARVALLLVAMSVGIRVWSSLDAADAARRAWGTTRTVWVVPTDTDRGTVVSVRPEQYPVALVPSDALTQAPTGERAARRLASGRVLVHSDLLGDTTVPPEWVVLAVPVEAGPTVVEGDRVSVFAPGRTLCDGVVADVGVTIDVAVPPQCAASAVTALTDRSVVLGRSAGVDADPSAVHGGGGR